MTTADLLDGAAVKRMVGDVIAHFGRLDILVNNGGGIVGSGSAVHPLTHDDTAFERTLFLNLTSTYYATRAALPQMVQQNHGRVIFIGSGYAKRGGGLVAYTAAKYGVVGVTRALAHQLPPSITVNTLSPGSIAQASSILTRLLPCAALMQRLQRHWSRGTTHRSGSWSLRNLHRWQSCWPPKRPRASLVRRSAWMAGTMFSFGRVGRLLLFECPDTGAKACALHETSCTLRRWAGQSWFLRPGNGQKISGAL